MSGGDSGNLGGDMQSGGGGAPGGASAGGSRSSAPRSSNRSGGSKPQGEAKAAVPADKVIDFSGKWKGTAQTPRGDFEQVFTFKIDGTALSGTVESSFGSQELSNTKLDGNQFSFEVSFGQFTMAQKGVVVDENKIVISSDRGEMTLSRVQ